MPFLKIKIICRGTHINAIRISFRQIHGSQVTKVVMKSGAQFSVMNTKSESLKLKSLKFKNSFSLMSQTGLS